MKTDKYSSHQRKGESFGKKLDELKGDRSAIQMAEAIYDDPFCFDLVQPKNKKRKAFTEQERKKDILSIARTIQRHLDPRMEAHHVKSNYLLAYSIFFNVSMDYLFGKIDTPCPNVEVKDISEKTGLSYAAV